MLSRSFLLAVPRPAGRTIPFALASTIALALGIPATSGAQESRDSIARSQRLDTVRVRAATAEANGYRGTRSRSSTRSETALRDVPQSVTVITRAQLSDQAMLSMGDVVRYIPGVTMGQGEGHRDAPTIRGNSTTSDFFVNGVRDDAQYLRDLYNVESVEALKGANALAFGRGGGGGAINRVLREARWGRSRDLTLTAGSFGQTRGTFDVGDAISPRAALRLTGVAEHADSYRPGIELDRVGINPTAALLVGTTTIRLGVEHFQDRRDVDRGIPSLGGVPIRGAQRVVFGDPSLNNSRAYVRTANATVEHGDDGPVQWRTQLRVTDYDKSYSNSVPGSVSAEDRTVGLSAYRNDTERRNLFSQTDLTVRAASGPVRHTVLVGMELGRQETDNFRETGYFSGTSTSARVPLDAPTVSVPVAFRQSATDADNRTLALISAGYVQYEGALGAHWRAIAGARLDRFALDVDNHRTSQRRSRTDAMFSPRAGLIYSPVASLSAYGSLGVSSLPASGDQFASLDATTETLAPERFTNREVGVKWDARPTLSLTAALFQLDRTNTRAPDPNTPGVVVQTGAQRTTGGEVGIAGSISPRWQVAGGWSLQRAEIRRRTSAAAAGATVPLVPHQTLSLWNRLNLLPRIGAALGLVHQGRMYASIDNTVTLPAFTRWDGALFAELSRRLRLQLNVENLLDAQYFPTAHNNNNIQPGSPRLLRLSLQATR